MKLKDKILMIAKLLKETNVEISEIANEIKEKDIVNARQLFNYAVELNRLSRNFNSPTSPFGDQIVAYLDAVENLHKNKINNYE